LWTILDAQLYVDVTARTPRILYYIGYRPLRF
jgi:hypothetical protein